MSMKEKIKVSLNSSKLDDKFLEKVVGAAYSSCCCGCLYKDSNGSSTADNWWANRANNLHSPGSPCDEV
jgi:hypothetical protein